MTVIESILNIDVKDTIIIHVDYNNYNQGLMYKVLSLFVLEYIIHMEALQGLDLSVHFKQAFT